MKKTKEFSLVYVVYNSRINTYFTSLPKEDKWATSVEYARIYRQWGTAKAIKRNIENHLERFGLKPEDSEYISVVEYELVPTGL